MTFGSTVVSNADRGDRRSIYRPYQHDSEPDSYYRQPPSRGPRPLTAIALKLQDPRLKCERNLGWSIDWAVAFIIDHLDSKTSPDAAAVLKHIRILAANLEREGYQGEIPYRIFNKLDATLFAGRLRNAVYLDIRGLGPDVSGATHCQGWGPDTTIKRVSIILNGDVLQNARSKDIVAALIHHMIHAYFLIACGSQQEKEVAYGRLAHGLHFGKIMMAIKKLSAANGRPLMALDFGHSLGQRESRYFCDEYPYPKRKSYLRCRGNGTEKWYCSHCTSDVDALSASDIDDWYGGVCKPLFDLPESLRTSTVQIYNDRRHILEEVDRAEAEPSTSSNEFIFNKKSVLVPASKVAKLFSVARAFEKAGGRYLEIHEDVKTETFERFLEFLLTETYSPDPKHIVRIGNKGPPVIKSTQGNSEPYLHADIMMFKMGGLMNFDELKGIALERMYRHSVTHEDPVSLLRDIYDGGEPDPDLKVWAKKFLMRVHCAGDGVGVDWIGLGGGVGVGTGRAVPVEPSNLVKLECEILGHKPAFFDLLEQSTALKYEVGRARRELLASNLYVPAGIFGTALTGPNARPISPVLSPYSVPRPSALGAIGCIGVRTSMIGWMSSAEAVERERIAAVERDIVAAMVERERMIMLGMECCDAIERDKVLVWEGRE